MSGKYKIFFIVGLVFVLVTVIFRYNDQFLFLISAFFGNLELGAERNKDVKDFENTYGGISSDFLSRNGLKENFAHVTKTYINNFLEPSYLEKTFNCQKPDDFKGSFQPNINITKFIKGPHREVETIPPKDSTGYEERKIGNMVYFLTDDSATWETDKFWFSIYNYSCSFGKNDFIEMAKSLK